MLHAYASGTIFGEPAGSEPFSVLALHGWGHDHHDFDQLFANWLPTDISALAVDLPGFGATPAPLEPWGSEDYARSLESLFGLFVDRPVLIGHSFGGKVALQLAVLYPERFAGLVLTGVPLIAHATKARTAIHYRLIRTLTRYGLLGERRLEQARQRYGSADYRAVEGVMREILVRSVNESYETALAQVMIPVEMVWGERDTAAPLAQAREAAARFAQANLTVVDAQGHMTPTQSPQPLGAAIGRLLC